MVGFARKCGYRRVVLAGHSTGANKVLHYGARGQDRRVSGIVLVGPVSDVAAEARRLGARALRRRVAGAERIARRDPDGLVPRAWGFWSARRYISLYRPRSRCLPPITGRTPGEHVPGPCASRSPSQRPRRVFDRPRARVRRPSAGGARGCSGVVPRARHGFRATSARCRTPREDQRAA
jgi:pimeloyl-ACP methyl ester carboxylesterase